MTSRQDQRGGREQPRVTFVTQHLSLGSIVYSNIKLAKKFLEIGYAVDFVGIEGLEPSHLRFIPDAIDCRSLDMPRVRNGPSLFASYLNNRRPGIVFVSSHLQCLIGVLGVRLADFTPKLVLRVHISARSLLATQKTFFDRHVLSLALRAFAPATATFAAVSQGGAADFARTMRVPADRVTTLYDPVLPLGVREFAISEHAWLDDPAIKVVLAVGRLDSQKDYPNMIRAFARLHEQRPDTRLLIIGEGGERLILEALVRDLGLVAVVALPGGGDPTEAYRKASAFVVSSKYEVLCNVIVEALDAGLPVVSTDCPVGPGEILERGRHGTLVPVGDPDALARGLAIALSRPGDVAAFKDRALDFHIDRLWPKFAAAAGLTVEPSSPA